MLDYPPYILSALTSMGLWDPEQAQAYVEAFRASWGGDDEASLVWALHEGNDQDRLFAINALGATRSAAARDELLPLLESKRTLERWASALRLGELREERTLPALYRMLTEVLPPDSEYWNSEYYRAWRPEIPFILGEWGKPESVPALRAGLQAALRVELALDPADEADRSDVYYWPVFVEDAIVYALGRLGGFGALAGIDGADTPSNRYPGVGDLGLPQTHLDQWRVHLVMGALHGRYTLDGNWTFAETPGLQAEVTSMLERIFGVDAGSATPALQRYEAEMGFYLSEMQRRERALR
ncbi:MAG: HEAT repeat domain-containing protein [Ktedonobacterales bacterium]